MKDYLVTVDHAQWNNTFIVSAKDAKDAIQQVWDIHFSWKAEEDKEKGYTPYYKKDLHARSLASLHNEEGKILVLN